VLLVALLLVTFAGLIGLLGVRTGSMTAGDDGGLSVRLDYAVATRPGLATPWTLTVERPGGFDHPVVVATSASYLAAFDINGVSPQPAESTSSAGAAVVWTFAPPQGDVLVVSLDARLEPGVQWRRQAVTSVESGGAATELDYTTWVMP
jgi:hypothetical protein